MIYTTDSMPYGDFTLASGDTLVLDRNYDRWWDLTFEPGSQLVGNGYSLNIPFDKLTIRGSDSDLFELSNVTIRSGGEVYISHAHIDSSNLTLDNMLSPINISDSVIEPFSGDAGEFDIGGQSRFERNIISDTRLDIDRSFGLVVEKNSFVGTTVLVGSGALSSLAGRPTSFKYNNVISSPETVFYTGYIYPEAPIDFLSNYWGSSDLGSIEEKFDFTSFGLDPTEDILNGHAKSLAPGAVLEIGGYLVNTKTRLLEYSEPSPTDPVVPTPVDPVPTEPTDPDSIGVLVEPGVMQYSGNFDSYSIYNTSSGHVLRTGERSESLLLDEINKLIFADKELVFDPSGTEADVYRLYKAAFNRQPDEQGLGHWIYRVQEGATMNEVAQAFLGSEEFSDKYGAEPSDENYVAALYQNVLQREAEPEGEAAWLDAISTGTISREGALLAFSDSVENQNNVIELIATGIVYEPWVV